MGLILFLFSSPLTFLFHYFPPFPFGFLIPLIVCKKFNGSG